MTVFECPIYKKYKTCRNDKMDTQHECEACSDCKTPAGFLSSECPGRTGGCPMCLDHIQDNYSSLKLDGYIDKELYAYIVATTLEGEE